VIVVGSVVAGWLRQDFIRDGIVDTAAMRPIMRAGYRDCFVVAPENRFTMMRPRGGGDLAAEGAVPSI
jgi:flavin reductase (DIM6/NTAB) family NADH-FMN oxidoreductase RutF